MHGGWAVGLNTPDDRPTVRSHVPLIDLLPQPLPPRRERLAR